MRNKLIELRKSKGLTQENMAKLLNISRSNYNAYELGTVDPPLKKAIELKKILKCDNDSIFFKSK